MIRWGILGVGNIAHCFCDSLSKEPDSVLKAISCRRKEKAAAFMEQYAAERYYLDYDSLLKDPEVDAVYLSLPHGLHREWAVKAVLCEKTATLSEKARCQKY